MSERSIIEICGVTKKYGDFSAIDRVDLEIESGEFFSLLGPSGCGKSTLLRMLAGFEAPTEGEIFIDGEPMSGIPAHQRPVNMVFQNYAIFPHLSVHKNIAFGMRKSGLSRHQIDERVEEILEVINLTGYGTRSSSQLSGGERQRVALARALIKKPKVLLLDEPLSALDKKLRETMQLELRALQEKVGITFVFVTHDQDEALTMSDRIAVMSRGSVCQVGTPEAIYQKPTTRFVAEFIGSMNFFPGTIKECFSEKLIIDIRLNDDVEFGCNAGHAFATGQAVVVAIRPENLSMKDQKNSQNKLNLKGKINQITYSGDRRFVYVKIPDMDCPIKLSINSGRSVLSQEPCVRDTVWIDCDQDSLLLIPNDET